MILFSVCHEDCRGGRASNPSRPISRAAIAASLCTLVAFGFVTPAAAADLPNPAVAPIFSPEPTAFNWTGFYAGVNGGFATDHFGFGYAYHAGGPFEKAPSAINSSGPVMGGQIGYNYQLSNLPLIGHAVIGVEADSDWAGVRGSTNVATPLANFNFGTRFENFGTLRARVGYNIDRTLFYLTGGMTYATSQANFVVNGIPGSKTVTRTGFFPHVGVVGAGVEYAFTNNLSVKAEYLYDFTGARFEQFNPTPTTQLGFGTRAMYHIARVGLNYRFDWSAPSPVVAKY